MTVMSEDLTEEEAKAGSDANLSEAVMLRLKALAAPGATLKPLTSVWEDTVIGVTLAVPAEGFGALLEVLRSELLPLGFIPFATEIAWREKKGVRTLGIVPGSGDQDLLERIQPSGIASDAEIEYPEIAERLAALREQYGLHVVSAGPCWVEIVLHTLPEDWEEFLRQVSGFGASGSYNDWYTEAQNRMETAQPGFSASVSEALMDVLLSEKPDGEPQLSDLERLANELEARFEERYAERAPDADESALSFTDYLLEVMEEKVSATRRLLLYWD